MTEQVPDAGDEVVRESEQVIRGLITEIRDLAGDQGFARRPAALELTARSSSGPDSGAGRQRLHHLLDQALDLGGEATQAAGSLGRGALGLARELLAISRGLPFDAGATGTEPVLVLPAGRPGETSSADLDVQNSGSAQADVQLQCASLLGPGAERIAGSYLRISPASVRLAPGATARLQVTLSIPADARAGPYLGRIQVAGQPAVGSLVSVSVV
jgi:hypothetical protein